MKYCKHCGRPTEGADKAHPDCAELSAQGWTDSRIIAKAYGRPDPGNSPESIAGPLTQQQIFWAVFRALWAFALTYSIVAVALYLMAHAE